MSDYSDDEELEELKRRKLASMQSRGTEAGREEQAQREAEARKQQVLRIILSPEARQRLTNIRITRPEVAESIELQLIQLYQSGRLRNQISDEQLKTMLQGLMGKGRDITIRRI